MDTFESELAVAPARPPAFVSGPALEDAQRVMEWTEVGRAFRNLVAGALAGAVATLIRWYIPLPAEVLTFFTVVIAVCLVTVGAGFVGGFATMIVGGMLTWYFILNPGGSWEIGGHGLVALLGYFAVTAVILATSQLYRLSEIKRQRVALELAVREAQHQRLFAREMSHRLKNAMAVVQGVASQTFPRDMPEVLKFEGRIAALAEAHNLLNEHVKQPTASIIEVVETAIAPFRDRADRFRVVGQAIPLPDQQVVALSLALHELATNAVKYGALSDATGWISIDWSEVDGRLHFQWKEHDGPAVAEPAVTGFGSRLLARSAMGATLRFEADGLRCTIDYKL